MSRRWWQSAWVRSLFPSTSQKPAPYRHKAKPRRHVPRLEVMEDRLTPAVSLAVGDAALAEGDSGTSNLVFVVTRSGDLTPALTVQYQTVDGTAQAGLDYQATSGTVSFASGQETATIAVPVNGDLLDEPDETFTVTLSDPQFTAGPGVAPAFAAGATFATGTRPITLAHGDLNGDGRPDLVAANALGDSVSVLLNVTAPGATTASYAPHATFAVGDFPISVVIGDVNGDGRPDIVTADVGTDTVSVLLNLTAPGATTPDFAARATFASPDGPSDVVLADLNGDGRPDL
ncbi:MAG TPA: FG-GAP-like repeat-containing protein, partial [Urbifossiella sp.]|nr:FG-GAP-like repeat-containing protein [Urbifossiella sp.]